MRASVGVCTRLRPMLHAFMLAYTSKCVVVESSSSSQHLSNRAFLPPGNLILQKNYSLHNQLVFDTALHLHTNSKYRQHCEAILETLKLDTRFAWVFECKIPEAKILVIYEAAS